MGVERSKKVTKVGTKVLKDINNQRARKKSAADAARHFIGITNQQALVIKYIG